MPALQLIFNELSIRNPAGSVYEARVWLEKLYHTAGRAIERANLEHVLLVPQSLFRCPLAPGYSFLDWRDDQFVERELREALQSLVSWGPHLDDFVLEECIDCIEVTHDGVMGLGITLAVHRDHAVTSVDIHPFQQELLPVRARKESSEDDTHVCNFYRAEIVDRRLLWLAERTCVKPDYEHARHHDPSSGEFRGGRGLTSPIPDDAREVYNEAKPADLNKMFSTWWGQNTERYLYRYAVSLKENRLFAHWNGTTEESNPRRIEDRDIPDRIRRSFPNRRR